MRGSLKQHTAAIYALLSETRYPVHVVRTHFVTFASSRCWHLLGPVGRALKQEVACTDVVRRLHLCCRDKKKKKDKDGEDGEEAEDKDAEVCHPFDTLPYRASVPRSLRLPCHRDTCLTLPVDLRMPKWSTLGGQG